MVMHIHAKAFAGTRGGTVWNKTISDFYIFYCKTDCSTQNFTSPQVFNMENYFNYHKILKSGYLYCEEKDSRQTFILTENLGHFSTEGVTAPCVGTGKFSYK